MRFTSGIVWLLGAIFVLFIGRYHLLDLSRAFETYTRFYPYLSQHPDTLYRHSVPNTELASNESDLVPTIMHRIQLGTAGHVSKGSYTPLDNDCGSLHSDWTHYTWTDQDAASFVHNHYPQIWPHYQGYHQNVQRANVLRYALLDHFGGVYLDQDIACLQSLDDLRHLPWLAPAAYPAGLSNGFMLSRENHPFLKRLLNGVVDGDLNWGLPYVETMLSTGCMYLSGRWMSYVRSLSKMQDPIPEADRVYVLADEDSNVVPHMLRGVVTTPLFHHGGASSWHEWDAGTILFIGNHVGYLLAMMAFGAVSAVAVIWTLSMRNQRRVHKLGRIRSQCLLDKRFGSEASHV